MIPKAHRATVVLAILAAGLAVFLVVDRDRVSDVERRAREGELFVAWRRADVTWVEIEASGKKARFDRVRGDAGSATWTIGAERADDAAVDKLLAVLEHARPLRKVEPDARLGLDAPRARVRAGMGEITIDLAVGGAAPQPEGAAYARVGNEPPVVVSKELVAELLRPVDEYRERRLVGPANELAEIALRRGAAEVSLKRAGPGPFALQSDDGLRASRAEVERILLALDDLRADSFLAALPAPHPAGALRVRVRSFGAKDADELVVGGPCPGVEADVVVERTGPRPVIACVPRGPAASLDPTGRDLADRRLAYANADEVVELRIGSGDVPLEVARKGTGFFMRSPEGRELSSDEAESVSAFLTALTRAEAASARRASDAPADARPADPAGAIRFTTATAVGDEALLVARDGRVYRERDRAWLTPSPALARLLSLGRAVVRPLRLLPRDFAALAPRRIEVRCPGLTEIVERSESGYRLVEPRGASLDAAAANALAEALLGAKAELVAARVDDRTFGIDGACSAQIALATDGGLVGRRLLLGRETEGGVFARMEGEEPVVVVSTALAAQIRAPLADREPLRFDPAAVEAVTVERGDGARRVEIGKAPAADEAAALAALAQLAGAARPIAYDGPPAPRKSSFRIKIQSRGDASPPAVLLLDATSDPSRLDLRVEGRSALFGVERARVAPLLALAP